MMDKLKTFEMESLQNVKIDVVKGDHKETVLRILNEFKEYIHNPKARTMTLKVSGEDNCFILNSGLCGNITSLFTGLNDYTLRLVKLFQEWPLFSGSNQHPIRVNKSLSEREEYQIAYTAGYGMYDKDDEYCQKRLDLLDFIIKKIETDFDEYVWVH